MWDILWIWVIVVSLKNNYNFIVKWGGLYMVIWSIIVDEKIELVMGNELGFI